MSRRKQGGLDAFRGPDIDDAPASHLDKIVGRREKRFERDLANAGHLTFAAKPLQRESGCSFLGKEPGAGDVDAAARSAEHDDACRGAGASQQRSGYAAEKGLFRDGPLSHLSFERHMTSPHNSKTAGTGPPFCRCDDAMLIRRWRLPLRPGLQQRRQQRRRRLPGPSSAERRVPAPSCRARPSSGWSGLRA